MTNAERQRRWLTSSKGQAYLKSKERIISERKYNRTTRRLRDRKHRCHINKILRELKLKEGCKQCGYKKHHIALQFHHINPFKKRFRLGESRNYSLKLVLREVRKCDILCSNCHHILEFNKRVKKGISEG